MRTIQDLLKNETDSIRVSCGDVWLYWVSNFGEWVVCQRRSHARKPTVLYSGDNEAEAVNVFAQAAGIVEGK